MNNAQKWYVRGGAYRLNRNPESLDSEEKKLANQFCKMFDDITPISEDMRLYRGIGHGSYTDQAGSFWSTSASEDIAKSFTREEIYKNSRGQRRARSVGEVLIIDVKPGVKVMNIGGVQREFVIDRNAVAIETNRVENGATWIWITVIPA